MQFRAKIQPSDAHFQIIITQIQYHIPSHRYFNQGVITFNHHQYINMTQAPSATFWQQFKTPILIASALAAIVITKRLCVGPPNTKDRDLTDQVIVITGANAGIGKETMKALALKNCKIVFGARDVQKSHQVHDQIIKEINPHAKIEFIKLDLADKDSILNFTQEIKEKYKRIDILINNAGIFLPNRTITANGFEGHIGINHLGHFYLTYLLWPLLTKAPHFRVINVSSDAHRAIASKIKSPLDLENFHYKRNYSGLLAYAKSKAANVIFTKELQRRIDKKKLNGICVSLHPGVVVTQIGRYFTGIIKVLSTIIFTLSTLFTKNAQQGAQTTLYTVLASQQQLQKGAYYKDCSVCQAESFTSTPQIGSKLWQISESQLQIQFQV